jgi:hypothetical protein
MMAAYPVKTVLTLMEEPTFPAPTFSKIFQLLQLISTRNLLNLPKYKRILFPNCEIIAKLKMRILIHFHSGQYISQRP